MKNTLLTLIYISISIPLFGQGFEYFYHTEANDVELVCTQNGSSRMLINDMFTTKILNTSNHEIESTYPWTTNQLISYDDSFCDVGIAGLTDYDITLPIVLNIDDKVGNMQIESWDIGMNGDPIFKSLSNGNSIKVNDDHYLISFIEGTFLINTQGEVIKTYSEIGYGAFMRSPSGLFILLNNGTIYQFNLNDYSSIMYGKVDIEFSNIWNIMYSNYQNKFYVLSKQMYELDLSGLPSISEINFSNIRSFTVFEDKLYFTMNETKTIFELDLGGQSFSSYFSNDDPNIYIRHLSHDEEHLIVASHYRINNHTAIPLLQKIPKGQNYEPNRVDLSVSNLNLEKKVNYLYGHPSNPDLLIYANVDLTFTFEVENKGSEEINYFTVYDDASTFFGQNRLHNKQIESVIPPGESREIKYTRTLGIGAEDNKTISVIVPGANYKMDIDLSDNKTSTDINLSNEEVSLFDWSIYPNPASNKLFINSKESFQSNYSITNQIGMDMVQNEPLDRHSGIDISYLSSGVYFLKLYAKDKKFSKCLKFVKM